MNNLRRKCQEFFEHARNQCLEICRSSDLFRKFTIATLIVIILFIGTTFVIINWHYNSQFKIYYSLDTHQNDKEIIHAIDNADKYVYFAIYYFTKGNIADALIRAKKRGLIVRGISDAVATREGNKATIEKLRESGIDVETQQHQEGIMHLKVLVTDKAYASGSYNWTASATNVNDEILEISTNDSMRAKYLAIIKKVLSVNQSKDGSANIQNQQNQASNLIDSLTDSTLDTKTKSDTGSTNSGMVEYDFTEAPNHIGEKAIIRGKVAKIVTSKSSVTFWDFCENFKNCPFSAVIFASDLDKFKEMNQYIRDVSISGIIKSYQGKAEIVLNSPDQIIK